MRNFGERGDGCLGKGTGYLRYQPLLHLIVHFGQGRVGGLTPARPATSLDSFFPLLTTAFPPVVFGLVLSNFRYLHFRPKAHLHIAQRLPWWGRNPLFPHPSVKSVPGNPHGLCHFGSRISFHSYSRMPHTICQLKSEPGEARGSSAPNPGELKSIAELGHPSNGMTKRTWGLPLNPSRG